MLTINALVCADSVLIPVQAAYLPVKGLEQLIKTIGRVQRRLKMRKRREDEYSGVLYYTYNDNRNSRY